MLSPVLSNIAKEFGYSNHERDLYLGGYMSLSFSVISLPLSLAVGILADFYDRKKMLYMTVFTGNTFSIHVLSYL